MALLDKTAVESWKVEAFLFGHAYTSGAPIKALQPTSGHRRYREH